MFRNGIALRRRWFFLLTLLAFGLALGIGAFLWQAVKTSSVVGIQIRIDVMRPLFTTIRVLVIGLVAWSWPAITRGLHRWGRVDEAGAARLLSLRWQIVTWLAVIELMLVQNLLGRLLTALQGTST